MFSATYPLVGIFRHIIGTDWATDDVEFYLHKAKGMPILFGCKKNKNISAIQICYEEAQEFLESRWHAAPLNIWRPDLMQRGRGRRNGGVESDTGAAPETNTRRPVIVFAAIDLFVEDGKSIRCDRITATKQKKIRPQYIEGGSRGGSVFHQIGRRMSIFFKRKRKVLGWRFSIEAAPSGPSIFQFDLRST